MATLGCDRGAQHAAALAQHEVDFFLGDFLGRNDKVARVLTVLVIDYDDKFAASELLHSLVDSIQFDFCHILNGCF